MTVSLAEYIAQANRGATQSVLGSEYLSKAFTGTPFTVDTDTNVFTTTFGMR